MPPSGHSRSSSSSHSSHSSSSHSSSSRSYSSGSSHSSHSSSSYSYSSGSSRSYSSGSSSRRSSSHSNSSYNSYNSSYGNSGSAVQYGPSQRIRHRANQPRGYQGKASTLTKYYGNAHDYIYYPVGWTDDKSGKTYESGYYDENGKYYRNIGFEGSECVMTCEYCGAQKTVSWGKGKRVICDDCGAPMTVVAEDKKQGYVFSNRGKRKLPAFLENKKGWLIAILVIAVAGIFGNEEEETDTYGSDSSYVQEESDSIYVDEIGRTCYLDGEDYYDPETQCWFWYNEDYDVWQYWYEGISSDFGDYGWMEYDYDEDRWYVEADDGEWIPVDENEYDTSQLWHFN